jgi:REP element-mobilizing transposase RayT
MKRLSITPKIRQLTFNRRGGARPGAGRKRKSSEPRVPHTPRERVSRHHPVHVTVRLCDDLPSLRKPALLHVLKSAFSRSNERADVHGLRIVHFAVQSNHLHLLVEVLDESSLSRGMQGLLVRIARNSNRVWRRKGRVFADRYHAHVLQTPLEVRRALVYVLQNARKHGWSFAGIDPYTSGADFAGWKGVVDEDREGPAVLQPQTWLLARGWKRHGLLDAAETPRASGRGRGSAALDLGLLRRAARR